MKKSNKTKIFLFTVLFMSIAFSSYSYTQEKTGDDSKVYIKLVVDGLACPFCAYGLEKKINSIEGVENLDINLKDGFVTFDVPNENKPEEEKLNEIVEDAGFVAREISFSKKPFSKEENQ
jgi:mercuric ion binding protein